MADILTNDNSICSVYLSNTTYLTVVVRKRRGKRGVEKTTKWELDNLYSLPITFRVIKSRRMRWGHVARMGESRGFYRVLWGNLRESDHLKDACLDGRIILRLIFRKWIWGYEFDRAGSG
jgi:hypothetical protein